MKHDENMGRLIVRRLPIRHIECVQIGTTKGDQMRGNKLLTKPRRLEDFNFDDLYIEISDRWEDKAKELQARRWRNLKRQMKFGSGHLTPRIKRY